MNGCIHPECYEFDPGCSDGAALLWLNRTPSETLLPETLPVDGAELWLKGSDAYVNGSLFLWENANGDGRYATADSAHAPTIIDMNSQKIVDFDGVDDYLNLYIPVAASLTLFIVYSPSVADAYVFQGTGTNNSPAFLSDAGNGDYYFYLTPDGCQLADGVSGLNTASVIHVDGGNYSGFFNGAATCPSVAATVNTAGLIVNGIGGGTAFDGEIGEFIIYNRELSVPERESVECYLSEKYSIAVAHACS